MSLLDRLIGYVSPQRALQRTRARLIADMIEKRHYEAASQGNRTKGWATRGTDANSAAVGLPRIRDRSRDLVRNNPYASRAVSVIVNNTVGWGIQARVKANKRIQGLWKQWAEMPACDADGVNNLYGLEQLALRTVVESGACLVRRRRRRPEDGLPVPLQLQVLEPDFLNTTKDGDLRGGGRIIQGIEFDAVGKRVAYHLYKRHPGDMAGMHAESTRVPAEDIRHIYRMDRPGQVQGVPWAAPIIIKMRDLDEYEDAYLLRQKIANLFVAFVEDPEGASTIAAEFGEKMEPGRIEVLPPGRGMSFANPPRTDGYGAYTKEVLRSIAAGYGITYEALTGDYSQVNFSSARMGGHEMGRNIDAWRWQMLIPQFCDGAWSWFAEAASMMGENTTNAAVDWTPPARTLVDPAREVPAIRDAVRSGLMSLSEAIREQGYDPITLLTEAKDDAALLDKFGLTLDTDPRRDKEAAPRSESAEEA